VNAASFGSDLTGNHGGTSGVEWQGKNPAEEIEFGNLEMDYNLMELLNIKMLEGRTFSKEYGSDSSKIIFNQAAIAAMGLQNPVGKRIKLWGEERQIIGVVKDFHFESLHEKVKPCFLQLRPGGSNILVKIAAGTEQETLERISKFYKEFNAGLPFDYRFLDEDYQALYAAEQRVAVLSRYFGGIAILISCLGLFGLAAFTAERRRKEIGIRKVLGASRSSIVYLLSGDFTKLVGVAICISLPLSYLIVKQWLNNFEYRIDLEWWYFVGAGLAALVIAWLTVSTQAVKAASVNPVHSLKDE
jgi:ABC-type antimicrobial peptide transport system permease subunit